MANPRHWYAVLVASVALIGGCWQVPQSASVSRPFGPPMVTSPHRHQFAEFQNNQPLVSDTRVVVREPGHVSASAVSQAGWQQPDKAPVPVDDDNLTRASLEENPPPENLPPAIPGNAARPGRAANARPSATGEMLRLAPEESAVHRAVVLAQKLDQAEAQCQVFRDSLQAAERQIKVLEQDRADDLAAALKSSAELNRTRARLEATHAEMAALRDRLRRLERQDTETLQEIVAALERVLKSETRK